MPVFDVCYYQYTQSICIIVKGSSPLRHKVTLNFLLVIFLSLFSSLVHHMLLSQKHISLTRHDTMRCNLTLCHLKKTRNCAYLTRCDATQCDLLLNIIFNILCVCMYVPYVRIRHGRWSLHTCISTYAICMYVGTYIHTYVIYRYINMYVGTYNICM